jgi:hypothetical protein
MFHPNFSAPTIFGKKLYKHPLFSLYLLLQGRAKEFLLKEIEKKTIPPKITQKGYDRFLFTRELEEPRRVYILLYCMAILVNFYPRAA